MSDKDFPTVEVVPNKPPRQAVLITGAGGYVGRQVTRLLAENPEELTTIVATDIREIPTSQRVSGVVYRTLDIRSPELGDALVEYSIDTVVHLAAVVSPRPEQTREDLHDIDVLGTENVLLACTAAGVRKFVYTSSGAAYGYHADNAPLLREDDPIRGNEVFAYSWHKRLVEEKLATWRQEHPELEQLVLRVSTVLGPSVNNQITAMFERPVVVGLRGADTPFCFAWDQDVVDCIVFGVHSDGAGVFNLTGDGVMTLREVAKAMGRRFVGLPEGFVRGALTRLNKYGLAPYGPEQTLFLRYRPVMANDKLKKELGFVPRKTSREAFEVYRRSRV